MLQTSRLTVTFFTLSDWPFIIELLNTPGWLQFIGDRNVRNEQQAQAYLTSGPIQSYREFGFGLMKVSLTETGQPIGMCGLLKRETLEQPDIGFAFLPDFAGHGYAFEAASAIIMHAQKSLHAEEIYAIVQSDNKRSISLLEKLHFEFKEHFSFPNKPEVLLLYAQHR